MRFRLKDAHETLCQSCTEAQIITDDRGSRTALCHSRGTDPPMRIDRRVVACSDHEIIGRMTKWEAEKIAWVLENRKGGKVGFKPPEKEGS